MNNAEILDKFKSKADMSAVYKRRIGGRPRKPEEQKMIRSSATITHEQDKLIDLFSAAMDKTRAAVIREALDDYIQKHSGMVEQLGLFSDTKEDKN